VLRSFAEPDIWPALLVYWEMQLLQEIGFGLDLTSCAATGSIEELVYVSPKSGRAVSREAGAPYADKMLALPQFLIDSSAKLAPSDIVAGFGLTGFFLERDALAPHGLKFPDARERLLDLLRREAHAA
jgi:DNA repair protein RecO (recombination protein O)